jgi:hypothetical protein
MSVIVGVSDGRAMPLMISSGLRGYWPVNKIARLGEQICIGVMWRVNLAPAVAIESMFGVHATGLP